MVQCKIFSRFGNVTLWSAINYAFFFPYIQDDFVALAVDQLVALQQHGEYQNMPIIGKVVQIANKYVHLQMMQGGYSKQWKPEIDELDETVTRKIHRKYVMCNNVRFTNARRLPIETKRNLQKLYLN